MINIEKYRPANDKSFFLEYNQKKVRILIKRIKTVKDHYENLIKRDEMALDEGYFKYRVDGINSLLFSKPIDVIFVDWDGKIIHISENYVVNKLSSPVKDSKFSYYLHRGSVERFQFKVGGILKHFKNK